MGILDAPSLPLALSKKVVGSAAGHFAAVRAKLDRDRDNVHIAVYGDSTGKGSGISGAGTDARWPYLLAQKIAAAYPTKTVIWHDWDVTTNAYLTPNITVQTGTGTGNGGGPFTVDIWNGSAVGQSTTYSQTWMFSITPSIVPDLIFINHGHNLSDTVNDFTKQSYYTLGRDVVRWFNANAPLVFIGQNPQTSPRTTANIDGQYKRMVRLAELCAQEGWGFINVMQSFLDAIAAGTAVGTLIKAGDGVHPEAPAGNNLYIDTIWQQWQQAPYATPASVPSRPDRLWLPATVFTPTVGTTAAAVLNSFMPVMSFPKTAGLVSAGTSVFIPPSWKYLNLWVCWTTSDGVAGNVVWKQQVAPVQRMGTDTVSGSNAIALSLGGVAQATGAAPTVAYAQSHTLVNGNTPMNMTALTAPNVPRIEFVQITRDGANASDTYAGTAHMYGLIIERSA